MSLGDRDRFAQTQLTTALEACDDEEVNFHIREALQSLEAEP